MFDYDFFLNIYNDIGIFSFHFASIIVFLWPMVSYLIIYKKA